MDECSQFLKILAPIVLILNISAPSELFKQFLRVSGSVALISCISGNIERFLKHFCKFEAQVSGSSSRGTRFTPIGLISDDLTHLPSKFQISLPQMNLS